MRFRPGKGAKLLMQRYFTSKSRILSLSKVSVRFLLVYILSTKVNASSALFTGAAAWVRGGRRCGVSSILSSCGREATLT